jgi:uncharacterized membrane protein
MKRFIPLLVLFLFIPTVSARVMHQFNTTVDVNEDGSSYFEFSFKFSDDIKEVEIPFSGSISNLFTEEGKCEIRESVGNVIHCEPPSPFMVGIIKIKTTFKASGLVEKRGNISYFSFDIPILWHTDDISVVVKLPKNMALAEKVLLPISPSGADIRSDGRRLITSWSFKDKIKGDIIPIRIYYETISPLPLQQYYEWIIVIGIVIIIGMALIYRRISKRSELVFSVLNENEKMIVDIIKKEGKKPVDQRKVVSLSGFSKAKVSRILQSLTERGIVDVERIGRKNKITLKKKFAGR